MSGLDYAIFCIAIVIVVAWYIKNDNATAEGGIFRFRESPAKTTKPRGNGSSRRRSGD